MKLFLLQKIEGAYAYRQEVAVGVFDSSAQVLSAISKIEKVAVSDIRFDEDCEDMNSDDFTYTQTAFQFWDHIEKSEVAYYSVERLELNVIIEPNKGF